MNRFRVIAVVTIGLALVFSVVAVMFGRLPPWPVLFWFTASHLFFCIVIVRVKPFRGPYTEPMGEPVAESSANSDLGHWNR
jgi:hypothetical protein